MSFSCKFGVQFVFCRCPGVMLLQSNLAKSNNSWTTSSRRSATMGLQNCYGNRIRSSCWSKECDIQEETEGVRLYVYAIDEAKAHLSRWRGFGLACRYHTWRKLNKKQTIFERPFYLDFQLTFFSGIFRDFHSFYKGYFSHFPKISSFAVIFDHFYQMTVIVDHFYQMAVILHHSNHFMKF